MSKKGEPSGTTDDPHTSVNQGVNQELERQSDEKLMLAYQEGNSIAFDVLYHRHSSKIYGYLQNRLRDRVSTDDVFQAAFLKLHQARQSYDASFLFIPWLFSVCKSVLKDHFRTRNRILEDPNPETIADAADKANEAGATFGNFANSDSPMSVIPEGVGLTEDQVRAIKLRFGEDLSFDEIAKKLDTSPSNARQLVSRAVRTLSRLMIGRGRGSP